MATLKILIGLIISKIEEVHDYIQIRFSDGTTLCIFNKYHCDDSSIHMLEGMKVKSIEEIDNKVMISFENNRFLSIGMADDDYNGPEAMVLRRNDESPVVWN